MTRQPRVDLYWSFRSPYSYLALPRVLASARSGDIEWRLRIVNPLAIRHPQHFDRQKENPLARPYFLADCEREAAFLGMAFRRPVPDPIVQDPVTLDIAPEQPYIRRLTHLGVQAGRRGRGLSFAWEVSRLLWDGSVDHWDEGGHLARAAERAGLDLADMERAIRADPADHEAELERNQQAQLAAGHWGVPLFVFEGEPFFGQDRFDRLMWRIGQGPAAAP